MKRICDLNAQALPQGWKLGYDRLDEPSSLYKQTSQAFKHEYEAMFAHFIEAMFQRMAIPWTISVNDLVKTVSQLAISDSEFEDAVKQMMPFHPQLETCYGQIGEINCGEVFALMLNRIFNTPLCRTAIEKLCSTCVGYVQVETESIQSKPWYCSLKAGANVSFYLGAFTLGKRDRVRPLIRVETGLPFYLNQRLLLGGVAESTRYHVQELKGLKAGHLTRSLTGSLLLFDRQDINHKLGYVRIDKTDVGLGWELFYPESSVFTANNINHDIDLVLDYSWKVMKPVLLHAEKIGTAKIVAKDLANI